MDAEVAGRKAGTFGHVSTFSSFFSHHISTMEGGMIVTDDRELYELTKSLRAHGWVRDLPEDSIIYEKREDDFYEAYRFILPGYNVRPIELSGAIGVAPVDPADPDRRRRGQAVCQPARHRRAGQRLVPPLPVAVGAQDAVGPAAGGFGDPDALCRIADTLKLRSGDDGYSLADHPASRHL